MRIMMVDISSVFRVLPAMLLGQLLFFKHIIYQVIIKPPLIFLSFLVKFILQYRTLYLSSRAVEMF